MLEKSVYALSKLLAASSTELMASAGIRAIAFTPSKLVLVVKLPPAIELSLLAQSVSMSLSTVVARRKQLIAETANDQTRWRNRISNTSWLFILVKVDCELASIKTESPAALKPESPAGSTDWPAE
jgi:hypothetical protein